MPSKLSTRRSRVVLDSDDEISKSIDPPVAFMDSGDDTKSAKDITPAPAPASGPWPLNNRNKEEHEDAARDSNEFENFLEETAKLYENQGDTDLAKDLDNVEYVETDDEAEDDEDEEEPPAVANPDFAEVMANASSGEAWLPPFLDHGAKLDQDYPDMESFLQDNEVGIADFRTMVITACRYAKQFTFTALRDDFLKLSDEEQGIHDQWYNSWCNADPDAVSNLALRAVPIQASAAICRVDFGVDDLQRLPHFPPIKVYGCYFDDITKTFKDGRSSPVVKLAYHGVSSSKDGILRGRIKGHITLLRTNSADMKENDKTLHYEEGCTDACPKDWDENTNGPWQPKWDCEWDFRASSISYPDARFAEIHQLLEGITQACLNMVVFNHPTRHRSRRSSPAVERFVRGMREAVEKELGRKLPDLQHLALNRSFPLAEPRRRKARP